MLAGRVGSAMAAELATMRVTEQLDALACLGVDPVKFLVAPRLIACFVLIPLLTVIADLMGLAGSSLICLHVYQIDSHHYWQHAQDYVKVWDVMTGLGKAVVFGVVLSLIACHRGFNSRPGAEGVGRAATESFVLSFMAIIILDFFLARVANTLYTMLLPGPPKVASRAGILLAGWYNARRWSHPIPLPRVPPCVPSSSRLRFAVAADFKDIDPNVFPKDDPRAKACPR